MTEDDRSPEKYLIVLQRWASPKDVERLLRLLGNPQSAEEFHASVKGLVAREEWRQRTLRAAKEAAIWITVVGGGILFVLEGLPRIAALIAP